VPDVVHCRSNCRNARGDTKASHAKTDAAAVSAPAITLPVAGERELRLDLFRGMALWLIFVDHLPANILTWFTIRNYGFSDATEIFIFISGYTAAFVYGRAMLERGFVVATARIMRRVWQIYVAHVFLFTIFLAKYPMSPPVSRTRSTARKWASWIFSSSLTSPSSRRCC
jgi:hypothetical protein